MNNQDAEEMNKFVLDETTLKEELFNEENDRLVTFPIKYRPIWDMYKKQIASFWTVEEIDLSKDVGDWARLNKDEQYFIKHILGFFAASDGIVNINLGERFINDVKITEAKYFYRFQEAMEDIHSNMYSLLIDTYVKDREEKDKIFNAIQNFECIKKKADWAMRWIDSDEEYGVRLIAFAIVEGVFFSGAFCSIFWLAERGLMPGLSHANELIARDEGMHCIGKGTLVSTGGFMSCNIENLEKNDTVLSYDDNNKTPGMIYSKQTNFKYQGKKECLELIFEDGRKLVCTPDHKILTNNGWKEAKDINLNLDKIKITCENPILLRTEQDSIEEKSWYLQLSDKYKFSTDTIENTKKACAFARILGYLLTDGCLTKGPHSWNGTLFMGHIIDVKSMQEDINIAFGEINEKILFDGCYRIRIKTHIVNAILTLENILVGKRSISKEKILPSFILTAPRIIVANFLAGLYGGDGIAPSSKYTLSKVNNINRFSVTNRIGFVFSKSDKQSAILYQTQILELLKRFDIQGIINKKQILPLGKDNIQKYKYIIIINTQDTQKFYKNIGFAHCITKQMRLAIASSLINLRKNIKEQNSYITQKFNEITDYVNVHNEANELGYTKSKKSSYIDHNIDLTLNDARDLAIKEWETNNPIYGHIKSAASIRDNLTGKTNDTVPFIDEKQILTEWNAFDWFRDNDEKTTMGDIKLQTPTSYAVKREIETIPCFEMKLIHRKNIGLVDTYDITVENTHNFTANGIVVHNCEFAALLFSMLRKKPKYEKVIEIFNDAVEVEKEFICKSLPCKLLGMNSDLMCQYIEFVADRLLSTLGYGKIYNVSNPFMFMERISAEGKTNFFEKRVSQYQKASSTKKDDSGLTITDDF
jgi:ribonucleotide reductase beta subunit family protein with ferritin-like domain